METVKDKGDNTAAKEIGRKLKMLKVERGLTSAAVCEKAGIKAPTLTAIENGYYNVGIRQITEVAAALGAHVEIVKNDSIDMFEIARKASEMRGLKVPEILPNTEDMEVKTIKLS